MIEKRSRKKAASPPPLGPRFDKERYKNICRKIKEMIPCASPVRSGGGEKNFMYLRKTCVSYGQRGAASSSKTSSPKSNYNTFSFIRTSLQKNGKLKAKSVNLPQCSSPTPISSLSRTPPPQPIMSPTPPPLLA